MHNRTRYTGHSHTGIGPTIKKKAYTRRLANALLCLTLQNNSGVARAWRGKEVEWRFRSWDTYQNVCVGVIASAEGAKLRLPEPRSPSRLGGLGERRKLPQQGLGRSPRNRRDFEHFKPKFQAKHFGILVISHF